MKKCNRGFLGIVVCFPGTKNGKANESSFSSKRSEEWVMLVTGIFQGNAKMDLGLVVNFESVLLNLQ